MIISVSFRQSCLVLVWDLLFVGIAWVTVALVRDQVCRQLGGEDWWVGGLKARLDVAGGKLLLRDVGMECVWGKARGPFRWLLDIWMHILPITMSC